MKQSCTFWHVVVMTKAEPGGMRELDCARCRLAERRCRNFDDALGTSLRPTILNRDGTTFEPAKFAQSCRKGVSPWTPANSIRAQEPRWSAACQAPARPLRAAMPLRRRR
jgi:hypothetical protein